MKYKADDYRPLIYICSPFAGEVEQNVQRARAYSRFAVAQGVVPIAPHLLFPQFMDDEDAVSRAHALHMGLLILHHCAELWYFGNRITSGMAAEIEEAVRRGVKIRHFNEDCVEVAE